MPEDRSSCRILFTNARLTNDSTNALYHVLVDAGRVARIAPIDQVETSELSADETYDLQGQYVGMLLAPISVLYDSTDVGLKHRAWSTTMSTFRSGRRCEVEYR